MFCLKIFQSIILFVLCTTALYGSSFQGSPIPTDPEKELATFTANPDSSEASLQFAMKLEAEARQFELEKKDATEKYQQAKRAYQQAGVNGNGVAFCKLGYLYEQGKLVTYETIEEYRLKDALAGYYIEKGGLAQDTSQGVLFHYPVLLEEESVPQEVAAPDMHDSNLSMEQKCYQLAQWYENRQVENESIGQRNLRYAYAGRYYDEAAMYLCHPPAFTALGHMYYFGRGIDISDMTLSCRLQAMTYYEGMYVTPTPESMFMLGFLNEQDEAKKSDGNAVSYYQKASDKSYAAASFRLGVRLEHGQGQAIDMAEFYTQAEQYYLKAQTAPQPPEFIIKLINMPEDLGDKIALIKKCQENLENLTTPTYGVLDVLFCKYLRKNMYEVLAPYWIDLSLGCYADKHGLEYAVNAQETQQRVKSIVQILVKGGSAQVIPDLTTHDQKLLNIQTAKHTFHNPAAQQMKKLQIRQYLGQEDQNWKSIPESQTKQHVELWMEGVQELITGLHNLATSFAGEAFLPSLQARIQALPVDGHKPEGEVALWPQGYLEALAKDLELLKQETQAIFEVLQPYQRSLSRQIILYDHLQTIKDYTGNVLTASLLQELVSAYNLMLRASKGENVPDKIIKHFQSARALKKYADSKGLPVDQARRKLIKKAENVLLVRSRHLHDFSIIGYDVIVDMLKNLKLSSLSSANSVTEASHLYRINLNLKLNEENFDHNWVASSLDLSIVSGKSQAAKASLTNLFSIARKYITGKEPIAWTQPILDLAAISYQDPNIGLYGNVVPDTLKDLHEKAASTYAEDNVGMSEQAIYEGILNEEIKKIRDIIYSLMPQMPGAQINSIDYIISTMESNGNLWQKIERKQNLLFMLRKSADWEKQDLQSISLVTYAIINGTEGRCPDGQADFFQQWITTYLMNNVTKELQHDKKIAIKLCLSFLLQNYKSTFIAKHASPFTIGESDADEDRTAMRTLLTQMLRLPLSLMGSYHRVLYPSYAIEHLDDKQSCLQIKNIMKRFFKGGEISYQDLRVTKENGATKYHDLDMDDVPEAYQVTIPFAGLSLKTLGETLREAFVSSKDKKSQAQTLPGLLPTPKISFVFPEDLVEDFLQVDPILCSFYNTFVDSGYTKGNKFFDAKAAFSYGYHLKNVLKDAAIVRLLQVGGYVKVPANFYQEVKSDWSFE